MKYRRLRGDMIEVFKITHNIVIKCDILCRYLKCLVVYVANIVMYFFFIMLYILTLFYL